MRKRHRGSAAKKLDEAGARAGEHMKNNATTDYAMRMVLYIAVKGGLRPSREISREMGIPQNLLVQLGTQLREASILQAKLGKHGGYMLAKSAFEISIYDVVCAIENRPQRESPRKPWPIPYWTCIRRPWSESYRCFPTSRSNKSQTWQGVRKPSLPNPLQ